MLFSILSVGITCKDFAEEQFSTTLKKWAVSSDFQLHFYVINTLKSQRKMD